MSLGSGMQTLTHALLLLWTTKRTESTTLQAAGLTLFDKSVKYRLVLGNYSSVGEALATSLGT